MLEKADRNKRGKIGVKIVLSSQPANSPDLNLNDLGFYSCFESFIGNDHPNQAIRRSFFKKNRSRNSSFRKMQEQFLIAFHF